MKRRTDGYLVDADRELVRAIEAAAQRARRLSDALLDAARIGTGQFLIRPVRMELVTVVRDVAQLRQATAEQRRLRVDAPAQLEVVWDPDRTAQLLANLVSNAVKYTPADGEIEIVVLESPRGVTLQVRDHGPGIPPDKLHRLFLPFSRLENETLEDGAGLGLYICQAIVCAHGGRIRVESTPGGGATFVADLPLVASLNPPAPLPEGRDLLSGAAN